MTFLPHEVCSHGKPFHERCIDCSLVSYREGLAAAEKQVLKYSRIIADLEREKIAFETDISLTPHHGG